MQEAEPPKLELSMLQVVAGALAAMTAAAVASTLGVAGTLLGAAVMSTVATVGSALYNHSFERARTRIRTRRKPQTGEPEHTVIMPAPSRHLPWGRIAGLAVLVFALALGGITAVEVVARRPLATIVRAPPAANAGGAPPVTAGTTLGQVLQSPTNPVPRVTPTPAAPAQAPAVPPVTVTPDDETPAEVPPTRGTALPAVTPTAPSADVQPTPSALPEPTPSALPEPTPLPSPLDTPSPPAEQP